ncbi:MAG: hypothetical protein Q7S33_03945 [Nanoarchaeota archaeon]|nr:hypothetical protein [Nanoarchaeota archaeon]
MTKTSQVYNTFNGRILSVSPKEVRVELSNNGNKYPVTFTKGFYDEFMQNGIKENDVPFVLTFYKNGAYDLKKDEDSGLVKVCD